MRIEPITSATPQTRAGQPTYLKARSKFPFLMEYEMTLASLSSSLARTSITLDPMSASSGTSGRYICNKIRFQKRGHCFGGHWYIFNEIRFDRLKKTFVLEVLDISLNKNRFHKLATIVLEVLVIITMSIR